MAENLVSLMNKPAKDRVRKERGMIKVTEYGTEHFKRIVKQLEDGQAINRYDRETELTRNYDISWLKGDSKYEIQIANSPDDPRDHMDLDVTVIEGNQLPKDTEKARHVVEARIWTTNKDAKDGPVATCYKLLRNEAGDKFWIKQTAREVRTENGTNYWKLDKKKHSPVGDNEIYQLTCSIYEASNVYEKAAQN